MSIVLSYNGYVHAVGEAVMSIRRQSLLTDAMTVYGEQVAIDLVGTLVPDRTAANLTLDLEDKLQALVAAYKVDGGDFLVVDVDADGLETTLSTSLFSASTIGGVRVTRRPSLPENKDAAYATFLNYQITLEAMIADPLIFTGLRSFEESVQFEGGGALYGYVQTRVGLPERQLWTQNQVYRATQAGRAVGLYDRPAVPSPIWPAFLMENPQIRYGGGRKIGIGSTRTTMDLGIQWRYRFESEIPLIGGPAAWGTL